MKLTIDLNDPKDCSEAISLITQFHGTEAAAPKQDERNPPPIEEPAPAPKAEKKPEPTPEPEAPADTGVTRDQLQALIKSHLTNYESGTPEMDAEKKALIDIMLKATGTASSFTAPEDKLGDAFAAITAYVESK